MNRIDPFKLIEDASDLYKLTVGEDGSFYGLMYPPKDGSIYAYGRPALFIEGVWSTSGAMIVIRSIDDSGMTMLFSANNKVALTEFRKYLNAECESEFQCPSANELEAFAKTQNASVDYW